MAKSPYFPWLSVLYKLDCAFKENALILVIGCHMILYVLKVDTQSLN